MPSSILVRLLLAVPLALAVATIIGTPLTARGVGGARYELFASASAERERAAAELDGAVARFESIFGESPPTIGVELAMDEPDDGAGAEWRRMRGLRVLRWQPNDAGGVGDRSLAHEACRAFLATWVDARLGLPLRAAARERRLAGDEGHPRVADWLEAAVGASCEPEPRRTSRRAEMRLALGRPIPLARLLMMEQPRAPDSLALFTAEAFSLLEYLRDGEEPDIVAVLAEWLAHGKTLRETMRGSRAVPRDPMAFQQRWLAWAEQQ
jgi:hypothetical protein